MASFGWNLKKEPTRFLNRFDWMLEKGKSQGGLHVFGWGKPVSGLPQWLSSKESTYRAGDVDLIPWSGRSSGGGYGIPLLYSCLENPKNRGTRRDTVYRFSKSRTRLR